MKRLLPTVGSALVLLLAAGCSSEAESFNDLSSLTAAVDDAGVACDEVEPIADSKLVKTAGTCEDSGLAVYLFESSSELSNWQEVGGRLHPTAVGPDWAVTGPVEHVEKVADSLNADMISPE